MNRCLRAVLLAVPLLLCLAPAAEAGSISGRVTDRSSGKGVPKIGVHLYDEQGKRLPKPETSTDEAGGFVLDGVPPGKYRLKADAHKPPKSYYVDGYWSGVAKTSVHARKEAATIDVPQGGPASGLIEIGIELGGTITGKIARDKGHVPLANIDLDLYTAEGARLPFDARSDAEGKYVLGPIPPGRYVLRADPDKDSGLARQYFERKRHKTTASVITVVAGAETSGKDFSLKAHHPKKDKTK